MEVGDAVRRRRMVRAFDARPVPPELVDSLLEGSPESPELLGASAVLYSAYAVLFAADPERAQRLSTRARAQGEHALCVVEPRTCRIVGTMTAR